MARDDLRRAGEDVLAAGKTLFTKLVDAAGVGWRELGGDALQQLVEERAAKLATRAAELDERRAALVAGLAELGGDLKQRVESEAAELRDRWAAVHLGLASSPPEALAAWRKGARDAVDRAGALLKHIPEVEPRYRGALGKIANQLKQDAQALADAVAEVEAEVTVQRELAAVGFDPTLPGKPLDAGSLHPLTTVQREVEDLFVSMGYQVLDGPEVELDFYNFQALNVPPEHPSREEQDTFYCDREHRLVLRTQTSPVQIRAMETLSPPFRVIAPGRVFRNEEQDATHEHTFHQVEGLVVGEGVRAGHLVDTLRTFLSTLFGRELDARLRPGYFPFVEPGYEFDLRCPFCEGGCRVCKGTTWVEFCGCGMVHPRVLEAGFRDRDDVDVTKLSGFAFGMGLDRLVMLRHGIDDIRHLMGGDLRFLEQF